MSIYVSFGDFSVDGDHRPPIVYQASHVLPAPGDNRGGSLDLGLIPGFITQDGWCVHGVDHTTDGWTDFDHAETCEPSKELPAVWPYLRVALAIDNSGGDWQAVVLDRAQVIALRDELTGWLARTLEGDPS